MWALSARAFPHPGARSRRYLRSPLWLTPGHTFSTAAAALGPGEQVNQARSLTVPHSARLLPRQPRHSTLALGAYGNQRWEALLRNYPPAFQRMATVFQMLCIGGFLGDAVYQRVTVEEEGREGGRLRFRDGLRAAAQSVLAAESMRVAEAEQAAAQAAQAAVGTPRKGGGGNASSVGAGGGAGAGSPLPQASAASSPTPASGGATPLPPSLPPLENPAGPKWPFLALNALLPGVADRALAQLAALDPQTLDAEVCMGRFLDLLSATSEEEVRSGAPPPWQELRPPPGPQPDPEDDNGTVLDEDARPSPALNTVRVLLPPSFFPPSVFYRRERLRELPFV